MALGRKLKAISDEKEGKFSIIRIIDKQIGSPRPKFSFKTIKFLTKKLSKAVDEKSMEDVHTTFLQLWDAIHADHIRSDTVFHPSELMDACSRKLYYDISGTKPTNPDAVIIGPQLQRIFDQGSWIHIYIQATLYKAGILIGMEVPVVNEDLLIDGRADALIEIPGIGRVVVEIKSINEYGFGRLTTRAKTEHVYQASIYAKELGISHILFLYWNKNTCGLKEFLEPVNESAHSDAVEIITDTKDSVSSKELPDRACISKTCERSLTCIYHTICWSK